MKLTFIYTDKPSLADVPKGARFNTYLEVPDEVKNLPDIKVHLLALGMRIAEFSANYIYLHCPDVGLKNVPLFNEDAPPKTSASIWNTTRAVVLYFEFWPTANYTRPRKCSLRIFAPDSVPFQRDKKTRYYSLTSKGDEPKQIAYIDGLRFISDSILSLLNSVLASNGWKVRGFHPFFPQNSVGKRINRYYANLRAEEQKKQKQAEKQNLLEAKRAERGIVDPQPRTHGAGRTVGARPGIYKNVQMRSQLEIRFAAELDERGIQWVYESEALGSASYLVDFYLPMLATWVEVKGRFDARDRQVLPEIAQYLKAERQQRLLVFTSSGKCVVVNPSGFREVERKNFWTELLR